MALLDKKHEPSPGELRLFGVLLLIFFGIIGGLVFFHSRSGAVASAIWLSGLLLCGFYYLLPNARRMIFHGWAALFYPLGWFISHSLMAMIYFLIITPMSLFRRLRGRGPLALTPDRSAKSYWQPRTTSEDTERYFRQF